MTPRRIAVLVAAASLVLAIGYGLSIDADARREGFDHLFDRRAAHAVGILDPREWDAMAIAGDRTSAARGGDGCASSACRQAEALLGGRWRGGANCSSGSVYRFTDDAAFVQDFVAGREAPAVQRDYRIVGGSVAVPLGRDAAGRPLPGTVEKRAGDIEVWTLGRSSYVRRVLRARDRDTIELVLVQSRVGRTAPVATLYVEGRSTSGGGEVVYRRCPDTRPG